VKLKFSECPDFSCSRSDGALEPVTSSSAAASELLRANRSLSAVVPILEFRAEKPVVTHRYNTDEIIPCYFKVNKYNWQIKRKTLQNSTVPTINISKKRLRTEHALHSCFFWFNY